MRKRSSETEEALQQARPVQTEISGSQQILRRDRERRLGADGRTQVRLRGEMTHEAVVTATRRLALAAADHAHLFLVAARTGDGRSGGRNRGKVGRLATTVNRREEAVGSAGEEEEEEEEEGSMARRALESASWPAKNEYGLRCANARVELDSGDLAGLARLLFWSIESLGP
jgi:hypothetical protein